MEAGFKTNINPFEDDLEHDLYSPDGDNSPPSATFSDPKSSCLSLKRGKRSMQKRVVSIPIKDLDQGSRLKGESAPPSDSWSWRKYGQKPIKGSPYPRGYYRCSSSKGCPARKQVERSRVDPTMLLVTYSCDHNHPWPASSSRTHHHHTTKIAAAGTKTPAPTLEKLSIPPEPDTVENFSDLSEESLVIADEFGWFADMASTSSTSMLESPIFPETSYDMDADVAMFFPIKEEDESLFADLGELPECAVVFRRGLLGKEDHAPWCGTT